MRMSVGQAFRVEPLEAFSPLFKRFAFPCRHSDLIPEFGPPVPELSIIFNYVVHGRI